MPRNRGKQSKDTVADTTPLRPPIQPTACLETPSSNTGLDSQPKWLTSVDWLDLTFRGVASGAELAELISDWEILLKSPIDFCSTRATFNGKHWAGSGRSESGALIWFNPPVEGNALGEIGPDGNLFTHPGLLPLGCYAVDSELAQSISDKLPAHMTLVHRDDRPPYVEPVTGHAYPHHGYAIEPSGLPAEPMVGEFKIAMSGRVLDRVDICQISDYVRVAREAYVIDCLRIDIALDDYAKAIPISHVRKASARGNFFNARYSKRIQSGNRGEEVGQTIYFGSPTSNAKLRVYDKTVESKGVCDCNRWEYQVHRKKAQMMFDMWLGWMEAGENIAAQKMADVVVSAVDFRDRSGGDPNRARCSVLPWYQRMCDTIRSGIIRLRVPTPVQSIQKSIDWVTDSVAASMASIKKALGPEFPKWFQKIMKHGGEKMSIQRRKMVALTERDQLCY